MTTPGEALPDGPNTELPDDPDDDDLDDQGVMTPDDLVDEQGMESFPASDPPAY